MVLSLLRAGAPPLDAAERACDEAIARLRSPRFSGTQE
jgi:hypothetical protein